MSSDEKLRLLLLVIRKTTEPYEDTFKKEASIKEFVVVGFTGIVVKNYPKIDEYFKKIRKSYRPLIKIIQIFELMLENFNKKELAKHRETLNKNFNSFINEFQDPD
jgi:glucan phosphoethanolaminetransferase (alkaline phosphatase superfamily)